MTTASERVTAPAPAGGRTTLGVSLAGVVLAVGAYLSLAVGVVPITPADLLDPSAQQRMLLTEVRLPRTAAILLSGAALAVAGLIMQRVTQNGFVSPSTSGTVEAAVLGVLIATLLVPGVSLVAKMSIAEAQEYSAQGQFAPGSMLPKVQSCVEFVSKNTGNGEALITSLSKAPQALKGETGTIITK